MPHVKGLLVLTLSTIKVKNIVGLGALMFLVTFSFMLYLLASLESNSSISGLEPSKHSLVSEALHRNSLISGN